MWNGLHTAIVEWCRPCVGLITQLWVDDPFAGEDVRLMTTHGPGGGRDGVDRICPRGPARRKIRVPSDRCVKKESARHAAGLGAELRNRVSNLDQISPHGHALT